ncbi:protein peroxin-4-like [Stylonychia lemnae]|uniref:Protein peroxin-4-like n=1 Tax=Stylonychia lemnae TaxID=5949 RepID=A0A078ABK0_STYLE|nr:protein peroxin-4-like [Stylonychia lemnae]|eukprot:CDW79675.1 protein peroxin-4-like [Stylonychia lemnae]
MALNNAKDTDILLQPVNDNLFHWQGLIKGPPETSFEKGWFKLDFQIDQNYPINPPKAKFITRIFHPNIHFETGEICLDILKPQHWSPAWTLESLCRAIVNLLVNPNADSPLNCDCGNQIRAGDMLAYRTMAYMYTVEFACEESKEEAEMILMQRKLQE